GRRVPLDLDRRERHLPAPLVAPVRAAVGDGPAADREAVGPAVEAALLDLRDVVRRQVVAAPVALVDRRPELTRPRVKREADRISEARRETLLARAVGVVARDRRAARVALRQTLHDEPTET